jgi:CO dehydrogenase/acetyl-CoA synthase delta subunit
MIEPGLYVIGSPTGDSPVLVTANYKLTIDVFRRELSTIDCWVIVLDTLGVNVWCAAGKGTFGTAELIARIKQTQLIQFINHRTIILPQLGAPGVAAFKVTQETGLRVEYGPVQSRHIPAYLANNNKASESMRRVSFPLSARFAVIPLETVSWGKYGLPLLVLFYLLGGVGGAVLFATAYLGGTVLAPLMLPLLPGRAFSVKGAVLGVCIAAAGAFIPQLPLSNFQNPLQVAAWALIVTSTCSFLAMNFTGSSTYTSLSGVELEIKRALPLQAAMSIIGVIYLVWFRILSS